MKQYNGLDLLKFILAILITILHLKPLLDYNAQITFVFTNCYTRIGVPTFFAIMGFLLFKKLDSAQHNASTPPSSHFRNYVRRLWILYIAWTILYLPQIIINYATEPKYKNGSIFLIALSFIRRFLLIGSWTPLWFFLASCYSVPLVYLCIKKLHLRGSFFIGFAVYIYFASCKDCFSWLLGDKINSVKFLSLINLLLYKVGTIWSGIAFGFLFIIVGYIVFKAEHFFDNKQIIILLCTVLSIALLRFEVQFHAAHGIEDMSMMLSLIPCSFFILQLFLHIRLPQSNIWIYLRKTSILIYGFHSIVSFYICSELNSLVRYFVCMAIVAVLCIVTLLLSKRLKLIAHLM